VECDLAKAKPVSRMVRQQSFSIWKAEHFVMSRGTEEAVRGLNLARDAVPSTPTSFGCFASKLPQSRHPERSACLASATALSLQRPSLFLSSRAKRADLRCAIRVPRSYWPTTATNHHQILLETPTSTLSFRVSRNGPRNRRSLGFARDDKKREGRCKERAVAEARHALRSG
jgi:hypothetical protein